MKHSDVLDKLDSATKDLNKKLGKDYFSEWMMDRGQPLIAVSYIDKMTAIDTLHEVIKLNLSDEEIFKLVLQRYVDSLTELSNGLLKIYNET